MTIKKGQIYIFKLKVSAICECADEFQNKIFQIKAYEMKNKTIYLFFKKIKILFFWHFFGGWSPYLFPNIKRYDLGRPFCFIFLSLKIEYALNFSQNLFLSNLNEKNLPQNFIEFFSNTVIEKEKIMIRNSFKLFQWKKFNNYFWFSK